MRCGAAPQTARQVAEAFYAGRKRTRGNCSTDGETYWLYGNPIARRIRPENEAEHVTAALVGQPYRAASLEFSFAGWLTQTTMRHLTALGLDCHVATEFGFGPKGGVDRSARSQIPLMRGRRVSADGWFSPEALALLPVWRHPVWQGQTKCSNNLELELV